MNDALKGQVLAIVEDDDLIAASLADYFGDKDRNTVYTYPQAEDLLDALPGLEPVNVFILDYRLPQMDGIELFKRLKPEYPDAKFVCISGEMSVELAEEAQGLGFDALILKPFDLTILDQNIVGILG